MPSYYRIINGISYDRALLESAEALIQGRGDGRISVADAKTLWEQTLDGPGTTPREHKTLSYILHTFHLTDSAREYLAEKVQPTVNYPSIIQQMATEFGAERLRFMGFTDEEILKQENILGDRNDFVSALREFFEMLYTPNYENESPYSLVLNAHELFPGEVDNAHQLIVAKLKEYLTDATLWLVPLERQPDENADEDFEPAENGEQPTDNWIFHLYLNQLSDHLYWAIIPRFNDDAYIYGFN
ncbi:MAG: hypothetical protein AAFQ37_13070 [Bacteroidota bacterium]